MNNPSVVALHYKVRHTFSTDYSCAEPLIVHEDTFDVRVEDGHVRFSMKDHFATEQDARDAVDDYIRAWELDAVLVHGPHAFRLRFDRSEIENRDPKPDDKYDRRGSVVGRGTPICAIGTLGEARGTVRPPTYPKPPATGLKRSPVVDMMLHRYVEYCEGKEPLTSMAYFCLTTLQGKDGRAGAAARYWISKRVLRRLSMLSSTKGGFGARKAEGVRQDLTQQERQFLEAAVKTMIHRAAEVAYDPDARLTEITMRDLPPA